MIPESASEVGNRKTANHSQRDREDGMEESMTELPAANLELPAVEPNPLELEPGSLAIESNPPTVEQDSSSFGRDWPVDESELPAADPTVPEEPAVKTGGA